MVDFLHSPNSEEAKDNKKGLQSFSDLRKQQDNPSEFTFSDSEDSTVAFVDSLLNFDFIGDLIEEEPEPLTSMASDGSGENHSVVSLGNAENTLLEKRINVGCGGFSERSGKTVAFDIKREVNGVSDCVDISHEKDYDGIGMIGDEAGDLDDFGYLIEEEMGKVTLDSVSSCLVSNTGDEGRVGIGGGAVGVNGNGRKCDGDGGSVIENVVGSESEEETSSSSSGISSSSSDDDDNDDEDDEDDDDDDDDDDDEKEVEMEEGEIIASDIDETVACSGDEDDEGLGGNVAVEPLRSKNELKVLPPVPPVKVILQPHHQTQHVGVVLSIVGVQVIVEGVEKHNPLDEGSILWITETRSPLGLVDEIFGPVKNPYYLIRYNSENEVPSGLKLGDSVCFVPEFANHILNDKRLYEKAYDASGVNDEEISEEEFSDDEKEAEYRKMLKMKRRGNNHHEKTENKKFERKEPKIKPGNWKCNHGPSQHATPVPPKPDLGNGQCSSSIGHDSIVWPGFMPPFSQIGQNPCFGMQSVGPNISLQPPQNMGVTGFPNNNMVPWLGQVNPQMLYQINMQNGGLSPFGQQFGMNPQSLPQNPVYPNVQQGFGAAPVFTTPWPGQNQNMFDPSVFATMLAAQSQQLSFPFNGGQQASPFNLQQLVHNSSSQPETVVISSQGPYQNLSNPSNVGENTFHSNIQQMAHHSSSDTSQGLNQSSGQNSFNPTVQFGMTAAAAPSQQQQMGFNSGVNPKAATFGRSGMSPHPNQGRGGGGRNPRHRGRGGGRSGSSGRGRQ